jgi:type IV fimbrial biogenesis protein FimT
MPPKTGFSLLELLITISLITISSSLLLPNFKHFLQTSKQKTQAAQLMQALHLARSEAMLRGITVTVCQTEDQQTCSENLAETQMIFTDPSNHASVSSKENILYLFEFLSFDGVLHWKSSLHRAYLTFYPSGLTQGEDGTFWYCLPEHRVASWAVIVNQVGRARYVDEPKWLNNYACG